MRSLLPIRRWNVVRAIDRSEMFERAWYLKNNPDVAQSGMDPILHYVLYGAGEGRDPSPSFSTQTYLRHNPDVAAAGANPLAHFIRCGTVAEDAGQPVSDAAEPGARLGESTVAAHSIRFNIDQPEIADGVAIFPVKRALTVAGWAVSQDGTGSILCEVDGIEIGTSPQRTRRDDVAIAHPEYGDALFSGFEFSVPTLALTTGRHRVAIKIDGKAGSRDLCTFAFDVAGADDAADPWRLRRRLSPRERIFAQGVIDRFAVQPKIYIWVHCRAADPQALRATLQTLASQAYQSWHAVITGEAQTRPVEHAVREEVAGLAGRITCFPDDSEADALAARALPRDLVLPLEAGDVLSADALFELACGVNDERAADFIYADERLPNVETGRVEPFLKPDWSPVLLLAANYVGRPWCATFALLRGTGRPLFRGGQFESFDLVLHCTERASRLAHVHKVLAQRGERNFETSDAQTRALKSAFRRRGLDWHAAPGLIPNTYRCRPKAKPNDRVSIIIPTCGARGLIRSAIAGLHAAGGYRNIEIIVVDNIADADSELKPWLRANADIVIEMTEPFNWSRFNNVAAQRASGACLLFLNDDIEVLDPPWLEALLEPLAADDVAIAGPRLLYPDHRVQHAGMFLAGPALGRHAFRSSGEHDPGYFGLALTQREVIAVTGACLLVRADAFRSVGGFDESHSVVNNDLDFCLRIHARGLRCVYTPFARLIHHEKASRSGLHDACDEEAFRRRWSSLHARGDPYFHPDLDRNNDAYQVNPEPVHAVFPVLPVYQKQAIRRILAVKVDHIGDFVTAFPAFRCLKHAFPAAELVALVAPASAQLAALEPAIDRVIPFQFFDDRSQLGRVQIDKETLQALAQQLAGFKFDLAVDLRKDAETRNLLELADAAVTAGFEHGDEFPWLDVALPYEGNTRCVRKRRHTADDLINLVDAIVAAGSTRSYAIDRSREWWREQLPVIACFAGPDTGKRPLVCVHPGAGNETKQWPAAYFADLINELLASEDVQVALIGGPDETPIGRAVLARVEQPERVRDLVGKIGLDALPQFLGACALFVGNDSGPKHIAAWLGIPTVGIHSGVVDAREWGPLGAESVALQRNMICSPCYKSTREECHRALACLNGLTVPHVLRSCRRLLRMSQSRPGLCNKARSCV
jgi:ADP-heptose:LPS heptosyltransferase/GT2 family glycosyltransferase